MSHIEQRRMVEVVAPNEALRELWAREDGAPHGIVIAGTPERACLAAPSRRLRAQIAEAGPSRTQITSCLLPKGHAAHAALGTTVHIGVVDGLPADSPLALYQWVAL